jgi:ceramide glucosyltransferase
MVEAILLLLVFVSCLYWVAAWWTARTFLNQQQNSRTKPDSDSFTPPVSILKPIKGLDADAYRNFSSFCRQDYAEFELLFGVSDADDPAVSLVERLQHEFPDRSIRLIVVPDAGVNPKSSILGELAEQARYDVLAISDSDIRVTPEYLTRVVAPLADRRVGLVTSVYRSINPVSLTARLEGLYLDVGFVPSAILAGSALGMRFGLGASMVLRKGDLLQTGGYAAIGDYLSDDYHIAARIAGLGLQVQLSDYVVENVLGETSFRQQWDREVRWARSIRALRPKHYSGLPVTFSTPAAALFLVVGGFSVPLLEALVLCVLLRWLLASRILAYLGQHDMRRNLPWLPVRDCLTALVWCCGLVGRKVTWRGKTYALLPDGRLHPQSQTPQPANGPIRQLLATGIRRLDAILRRRQGIYEFSDHPECLLRISVGSGIRDVELSDGTRIKRDDRVADIHLWNERIPNTPELGRNLAWGKALCERIVFSLEELTKHIESDPELQGVRAFRADLFLDSRNWNRMTGRLSRYLGFEFVEPESQSGFRHRCRRLGENLLRWGLTWAYNSGSLKGRSLLPEKHEAWISREGLLKRFGRSGRIPPNPIHDVGKRMAVGERRSVNGDPSSENGIPPNPRGIRQS